MDEQLKARLRTDLAVQIAVLPRTLYRAFAGYGVRRRRQLSTIDIMLENFATRLQAPFIFTDDNGREPSTAELYEVVKGAFLSIDDATVAVSVTGLQEEKDEARRAMARQMAEAIEARWSYAERPTRQGHR